MKNLKIALVVAFISLFSNAALAQIDPIDKDGLALGGYDVVAYHTVNKAVKGNKAIVEKIGATEYRFVSKANAKAFKANPEKYLPACAGYCAWGVAAKDSKFSMNPETFKVVDNKLYLFFNGDFNGSQVNTLDIWNKDEATYLKTIDTKWSKIQ
ncbi:MULTISPECIES: YHS domain-containing (seleno)protein [Flavobacterium]|uniref:YHS domain protein n=1 Tax=Flavobacterium faecale TaxID=1355330 RepID=A0A2S1LBT3_9FLAO|nr:MULTISPECIES: YHS domain-containing (seleno)protein [Flavobacterium]AWG21167.1 hypothetical protein FFWV33_06270 [Flavobacterium faecale]MCW2120457.1 YHS domain-containing protein [Flavobacterium sp. 7A]